MDNVLPRYSRPHGADCSWPEDPGGTRPTLPPQRVRALPEVGGGTGHSAEASGWGPHSRRLYRPLVSKAVAGELSQSPEPPPGPLTTTRRPLEGESTRIPYAARGPGGRQGCWGQEGHPLPCSLGPGAAAVAQAQSQLCRPSQHPHQNSTCCPPPPRPTPHPCRPCGWSRAGAGRAGPGARETSPAASSLSQPLSDRPVLPSFCLELILPPEGTAPGWAGGGGCHRSSASGRKSGPWERGIHSRAEAGGPDSTPARRGGKASTAEARSTCEQRPAPATTVRPTACPWGLQLPEDARGGGGVGREFTWGPCKAARNTSRVSCEYGGGASPLSLPSLQPLVLLGMRTGQRTGGWAVTRFLTTHPVASDPPPGPGQAPPELPDR